MKENNESNNDRELSNTNDKKMSIDKHISPKEKYVRSDRENVSRMKVLMLFFLFFAAMYLFVETVASNTSDSPIREESNSRKPKHERTQQPLETTIVDEVTNYNQPNDKHIKVLDISEKSLAFSRVATVGKVSIFIISAHWCRPCRVLKDYLETELETGNIDSRYVDIYYCLVTKNNSESEEDLAQRQAYRHIRDIDGLVKVYPTTYILAPTTNCFTYVQGAGPDAQEKIVEYAKKLSVLAKESFNPSYLEINK